MADINDLAQKIAFYQAGGKDPGTSNADQFNQGYDMVHKIVGDVLAIKKANLENRKTVAETKKLDIGNQPVVEALGTPLVKNQIAQAESADIPVADLTSGHLNARQTGIDHAAKTSRDMTSRFGSMTTDQAKDMALMDYYAGGKGAEKIYLDIKTRELHAEPGPNRIKVSNNTGATIATQPLREAATTTRQMEMERLNVEPSVKARYNEMRGGLRIAEQLESGLRWAKKNNLEVTGLLNSPIAQFREYVGTLPKEQQQILTDVRRNFAAFGRKMGGTAFTDTEKAIFGPITPQLDLPAETNLNRIGSTIQELQNMMADEEELAPGLRALYIGGGEKNAPHNAPNKPSDVTQPTFDPSSGKWSDPEKQKRYEAYKAAHP